MLGSSFWFIDLSLGWWWFEVLAWPRLLVFGQLCSVQDTVFTCDVLSDSRAFGRHFRKSCSFFSVVVSVVGWFLRRLLPWGSWRVEGLRFIFFNLFDKGITFLRLRFDRLFAACWRHLGKIGSLPFDWGLAELALCGNDIDVWSARTACHTLLELFLPGWDSAWTPVGGSPRGAERCCRFTHRLKNLSIAHNR